MVKGGNAIAIGLMAKATNEKVGGNSQTAVGVASYADGEGLQPLVQQQMQQVF